MTHILHFGLGNFARAHLLDYTDQAGGWTVTGVSLRSPDIRNRLHAQGFHYTLAVQGQTHRRVIKSLQNILDSARGMLDSALVYSPVVAKEAALADSMQTAIDEGQAVLDSTVFQAELDTALRTIIRTMH